MDEKLKQNLLKLAKTRQEVLEMLESTYELEDKNRFDSEIKKLDDMIMENEQLIKNTEESDRTEGEIYLAESKIEKLLAKYRWFEDVEQKRVTDKDKKLQICVKKICLIYEAIEQAKERLKNVNEIGINNVEMKIRYLLYLGELRLLKDILIFNTSEIGSLKGKFVKTNELIDNWYNETRTYETLDKINVDFDHPIYKVVEKRKKQSTIYHRKISDLQDYCFEPDRYNPDSIQLELDLPEASEYILSDIPEIPKKYKKWSE